MSPIRQLAHVLRKDIRRTAGLLLGVGAFMLLHTSGALDAMYGVRFRVPLPVGLLPLLLALCTVAVVQHDSPSDERAFWATRPIGPGVMLGAKLAFVAIFLLAIPLGVQAVWFEALGAGSVVLGLTADSALHLASVLALAAAGAAVTRSIRSFFVLALVAWTGWSILAGLTTPESMARSDGALVTQVVLRRAALLVLGLSLVTHQYLTRATGRTVLLGAVGMAALVIALPRTTLDWSSPAARWAEPAERTAYPAADRIEFGLIELDRRGGLPLADDVESVTANLEAIGVGAATFRLTGLATRVTAPGYERSFDPLRHLEGRQMLDRFLWHSRFGSPGVPEWSPVGSRVGWFSLMRTPAVLGERGELEALPSGSSLEIHLAADVFEPVVLGRLAPTPGATLTTPDGTLEVTSASGTPRSLRVEVAHRWSARRALEFGDDDPFGGHISFALFSPRYQEYMVDFGGSASWSGRRSLVGGAGLDERRRWLAFNAARVESSDGPGIPPDWFEDVEVVVIAAEYAGSFERDIVREVGRWPGDGERVTIDGRRR